ncbi:MAG: metallophosphoesterase [Myxococcales bacterium]|nr:metallophosphoesterase [Myxococcota bacterium]MDW8282682.1 metallophosphoesterase [Myxococcales bacterium]
MPPLVLAHLSDLHVSTYGDTFHDRVRIVKRSAEPLDVGQVLPAGKAGAGQPRYEQVWQWQGWRGLRDRARGGAAVLLDPDGYSHPVPPGPLMRRSDPQQRAAERARHLHVRRATVLAEAPPAAQELASLLAASPANTNLRLLRAAPTLAGADVLLITGDLTDDGDGYELVLAAFRSWAERGRLLAIPGNHDLYLFPFGGSGRPRATHQSKRAAWREFARRLGLEIGDSGAWVRCFPEAQTILVGLDSCVGGQPRFYRHNGAIGKAQLSALRQIAQGADWRAARHRIVAFHHHVVPLPQGIGRRAPSEIGMRLDDAQQVAEVLNEIGATLVLHGHRHISEARQPAGCRFRLLAAPSLTLGCKSGDRPSYWRVELDDRADAQRVYVPVEAVPQDNDPEA